MKAVAKIAEPAARELGDRQDQYRAHQWPEHSAQATDQRKHRDLNRQLEGKGRTRINKSKVHGLKAADQTGQKGRHHHRCKLCTHRIDTDRARSILAFPHRDQVVPEAGMHDAPGNRQRQQQEAKGDDEIDPFLSEHHPLQTNVQRWRKAARAAGQTGLVDRQQTHNLKHRDRCQCEKGTAQPKAGVADQD